MKAAILLVTSAWFAGDVPVATAQVGGACGSSGCASATCAVDSCCDPCGQRAGFLSRLRGMFHRNRGCDSCGECSTPVCAPAPTCCAPAPKPVCCAPAPKPVCCAPAPVCAPACDPCDSCGHSRVGFLAKLRARFQRSSDCCGDSGTSCGSCGAATCGDAGCANGSCGGAAPATVQPTPVQPNANPAPKKMPSTDVPPTTAPPKKTVSIIPAVPVIPQTPAITNSPAPAIEVVPSIDNRNPF